MTLTQQIERSIKEKAQLKAHHLDELAAVHEEKEEVKELRRENAQLRMDCERYKQAYNDLILGRHTPTAAALTPSTPAGGGASSPVPALPMEAQTMSAAQLSQLEGMKELVVSLTEQLTDKDEAFKHLRKTNQILGLRVKELEDRFREELAKGGGAGTGAGAVTAANRATHLLGSNGARR